MSNDKILVTTNANGDTVPVGLTGAHHVRKRAKAVRKVVRQGITAAQVHDDYDGARTLFIKAYMLAVDARMGRLAERAFEWYQAAGRVQRGEHLTGANEDRSCRG